VRFLGPCIGTMLSMQNQWVLSAAWQNLFLTPDQLTTDFSSDSYKMTRLQPVVLRTLMGCDTFSRVSRTYPPLQCGSATHGAGSRATAAASVTASAITSTSTSAPGAPAGDRPSDPWRLAPRVRAGRAGGVTTTRRLCGEGAAMARAPRATSPVVYQIKVTLKGSRPPI
jgi:hypothetical protein